ncbi:MAG: transketolase C-terminal domain-containing protein, partial [Thermodesulfobacteriota bacterium]
GLALMHEMLHFAAGARAPVVMVAVNRTLALPWAFWSDQTDSLAQRDTGWMQIYAENNQESVDSVIQAFKWAESLLLPCMVVLEANFISHFMEPVELPDQETVLDFIKNTSLPGRIDPDNPGFVGGVVNQKMYRHYRYLAQQAMMEALGEIEHIDADFGRRFGRRYGLVEAVEVAGADLVLVTAGTITSTARDALDQLKEEGYRIGLFKIRVFRPFPKQAVLEALEDVSRIAVVERNISLGGEGIFCAELKTALIHSRAHPRIQGYLAGIGGTDVNPALLKKIIHDALERQSFSDFPIWVTEDDATP